MDFNSVECKVYLSVFHLNLKVVFSSFKNIYFSVLGHNSQVGSGQTRFKLYFTFSLFRFLSSKQSFFLTKEYAFNDVLNFVVSEIFVRYGLVFVIFYISCHVLKKCCTKHKIVQDNIKSSINHLLRSIFKN